MRLKDKTIIVTGAAKGLGRGAVIACMNEGADVVAVDIDRKALRTLEEEIPKPRIRSYGSANFIWCDVRDETSVKGMLDKVIKENGKIDGLVSNAGTAPVHLKDAVHTSLADWKDNLDMNLTSHFIVCKNAIPLMTGGGSIVITSSISAQIVTSVHVSYTTTKHAINGFVKHMAVEAGHDDIRVNSILPGGVLETTTGNNVKPHNEKERPPGWIPIRRFGYAVEEYGATIAFLLSEESGYITGTNIPVDGGYLTA